LDRTTEPVTPKATDDPLETGEEAFGNRFGRKKVVRKMIEVMMIGILILGLATKKKPVFGQLTLTGEMALDWLKPGSKIVAGKIMIGNIGSFPEYNVPEWAQDRSTEIAVIVHANEHLNPLLVTQKSVLRAIESKCVEWEAQGAECFVEKAGSSNRAVLVFAESQIVLEFKRDLKAGKFAPYTMEVTEN